MNISSVVTVIIVWILVGFLSISYYTLYLPEIYRYSKTYFYLLTPFLIVSQLLGCYSYYKAVFTSPGYPNQNLILKYQDKLSQLQEQQKQQQALKARRKSKTLSQADKTRQLQNLTHSSYCVKCKNVKQPRVHHCKICNRCIQRMDHHCPYIGNCVGRYNHKYFLLFILYVTIALCILWITILIDYVGESVILNQIYRKDDSYYYLILVVGLLSVILSFLIGLLFCGQTANTCINLTTLQTFYRGIHEQNPFDKDSLVENIKEIMGESFWLLPTRPFPEIKDQSNVNFNNDNN